jgi:hypothetical protein
VEHLLVTTLHKYIAIQCSGIRITTASQIHVIFLTEAIMTLKPPSPCHLINNQRSQVHHALSYQRSIFPTIGKCQINLLGQAPKTIQRKDELGVAVIKVEIQDYTGWVKLIAHLRTLGGPGFHSDWARDWYKNILCLSTEREWQEVSGQ